MPHCLLQEPRGQEGEGKEKLGAQGELHKPNLVRTQISHWVSVYGTQKRQSSEDTWKHKFQLQM